MEVRKVNSLMREYKKVADLVSRKDINNAAKPVEWYYSLLDWKKTVDETYQEVRDNNFLILSESEYEVYKDKVVNELFIIFLKINNDFPEISLTPNVMLPRLALIEGIDEIIDAVKEQREIKWGDVIRIVFYSLDEFNIKLLQRESIDEEFFYLRDTRDFKKSKTPTIHNLEDIWINKTIPYRKLINYMLSDNFEIILIEKTSEGGLIKNKEIDEKYFKGLLSASIESGLITDTNSAKGKISGKEFARILSNTIGGKMFQAKYYQNFRKMRTEFPTEKKERNPEYKFYSPFINIVNQLSLID